ncbi:MAG: DUF3616 domain-containing protein [Candidatus Omnitrophica bacterium]|nr:DUF3616 domain-containing protein [Candidatus Omnitrophota bacterium]
MDAVAMRGFICLLAFALAGFGRPGSVAGAVSSPIFYYGMSDASGAVPIGTDFFAVANDEDNILRIYRRDAGGPPVKMANLSSFLDLAPGSPETDLEAGTRIGDRAYWLSSHGRNRKGKERANRDRFFATTILMGNNGPDLVPVGKPYMNLLDDLVGAESLRQFNLAEAAQKEPKAADALNLEGLCATPEGQLLIGFRNPIPEGRAMIVPLINPERVIEGSRAQIGEPILLDLGGLGIRDMTYADGKYVIVAGPYNEKGPFRLYEWTGGNAEPRRIKHVHLKDFHAEAITVYPDKGLREFQLLSDDGTRLVSGKPGKEWPKARQQFRSVWVRP